MAQLEARLHWGWRPCRHERYYLCEPYSDQPPACSFCGEILTRDEGKCSRPPPIQGSPNCRRGGFASRKREGGPFSLAPSASPLLTKLRWSTLTHGDIVPEYWPSMPPVFDFFAPAQPSTTHTEATPCTLLRRPPRWLCSLQLLRQKATSVDRRASRRCRSNDER